MYDRNGRLDNHAIAIVALYCRGAERFSAGAKLSKELAMPHLDLIKQAEQAGGRTGAVGSPRAAPRG